MTRRERFVIRAGTLLVAAALFLRLGSLLRSHFVALGDRVGLAREMVARQEALVVTFPQLERRADSLAARVLALADRLVPGRTEPEAQAELLAQIESAIVQSGAAIEQTEAVPDSVGFGRLRRVTARAVWQADFPGVLRMIRRLEFGPTLLTVEEIQLSVGQPDQIRAALVVEGWYLAGDA